MITASGWERQLVAHADSVLEAVHRNPGRFVAAMDAYLRPLREAHLALDGESFATLAGAMLDHPLRHLLHADPLTYRSYTKPRGYAGDAVTFDYIHGRPYVPLPPMSAPARQVFGYTTQSQWAQAVRYRRDICASLVDRRARASGRPMTAIAIDCGHLREAANSKALAAGQVRWLALDRDPDNLLVVEDDYGELGVEPIHASTTELLEGQRQLPAADLIYTAGGLDQLEQAAGEALLAQLFEQLAPGGELVYCNFLPGQADCGYRACYMDWQTHARTPAQAFALSARLPAAQIASRQQWQDLAGSIAFVCLRKRSD